MVLYTRVMLTDPIRSSVTRSAALFTLFFWSAAASAQAPQQPSPDAVAQIRAARERSNRAIAARDIEAFGESIAEDYVMVRGKGVFVPSRQAYLEDNAADFKKPDAVRYERIPDKIELSTVLPIAAEHGHWIATSPNGKIAYGGTYLAMWRQGKKGWQLRSELFVLLSCQDEAACAAYRK